MLPLTRRFPFKDLLQNTVVQFYWSWHIKKENKNFFTTIKLYWTAFQRSMLTSNGEDFCHFFCKWNNVEMTLRSYASATLKIIPSLLAILLQHFSVLFFQVFLSVRRLYIDYAGFELLVALFRVIEESHPICKLLLLIL